MIQHRLFSSSSPITLRYGTSVTSVIIVVLIHSSVRGIVADGACFMLYVVAVFIGAWRGGIGPGLLAITLSLFPMHYFFVAGSSTAAGTALLPNLFFFVAFSIVVALFAAAKRRRADSLQLEVDELRRKTNVLESENKEHKHLLNALQKSESDLAEAQRIAGIGSWSFDIADNVGCWSEELYRIFDVEKTSPDITYETFISRVHPDDRIRVLQVNATARMTGEPFEVEYRIVTLNGKQKVIREIGYATKNAGGIVSRLFGTAQDITERKRSVEALRESDKRFRALVENTSDAIELLNEKGEVLYATPSTVQMLGYALDEYIGKNVFDLVHTDDKEFAAGKLQQLLQSPRSRATSELRLLHKNGTILWIDGIATNLLDEPSVRAIVVNYRNITERKRAEETIRLQSARAQLLADISQTLSHRLLEVQENERRMLARELHDEIGQMLTAIKIDLQVIGRKELQPDLHARIEENIATLDRCLEQIRNLSLDLRPSVLDDLGLIAALRWQLQRQSERAGFNPRFVSEHQHGRFHTDIETTCFRIVQESLTNISRHAAARNVEVIFEVVNNWIELSVRDDGKGFDTAIAASKASGGATVGILSMQERAKLFGGNLVIASKEGEGTIVRLQLPVRAHIQQDL